MKHHNWPAIALALVLVACGGEQTVASKSAAAFREAQKTGKPIGGDAHGGHSAGGSEATTSSGDHATMTGMNDSTMPGMDHSKMPGQPMAGMDHSKVQGQSMAGMDHSKMQGQPMAGMDHSKMPGQPMAGMDHSKMPGQTMTGMDHGNMPGMEQGAASGESVAASAPTTSSEMQAMRPSATLRPDPFDAPVAISVSEAMKASAGGGKGMQMKLRTNR